MFFGIWVVFWNFAGFLEFSNDFLEFLESRNRKFKLHRRHWALGYRLRRELSQCPWRSLKLAASPNRKYVHSKKISLFLEFQVFLERIFQKIVFFWNFHDFLESEISPKTLLPPHGDDFKCTIPQMSRLEKTPRLQIAVEIVERNFPKFQNIFWNLSGFLEFDRFFGIL